IAYLRDGARQTAQVTLAEAGAQRLRERNPGGFDALAGVRLAPLDRSQPARGAVDGVVVAQVAPGSRAARAGLEPGDVITAVNRRPVDTIRDIDRALENAPGAVALTVWRDGRTLLVILRS
ncbi:MAG: PDZ domain-containing protein, partial [Rhodobacteraceae bacterium]|nr:PDZ domain-containing protein [Paracoccaceae bacterium]